MSGAIRCPERFVAKVERTAYRRGYAAGVSGKPQPGALKHASASRQGWDAGRKVYDRNRQLQLFAERAASDQAFQEKVDTAKRLLDRKEG